MRTVTPEAAQAIRARITGPVLEPIRAVNNTESIARNGVRVADA